jgi:hypothetical protein
MVDLSEVLGMLSILGQQIESILAIDVSQLLSVEHTAFL